MDIITYDHDDELPEDAETIVVDEDHSVLTWQAVPVGGEGLTWGWHLFYLADDKVTSEFLAGRLGDIEEALARARDHLRGDDWAERLADAD
jgi:hypothetical protein